MKRTKTPTQPAESLREYERKRDFRQTSEPSGLASKIPLLSSAGTEALAPRFVVQEHHASRLHYDFRLELDGVLKSWAVPKGPSLDPTEQRLAVMVEDHPLEYAHFEGKIPQHEYGGGTVIVWDQGSYAAEEDRTPVTLATPEARRKADALMREGLEAGKLSFTLFGSKLLGSWTLVRTNRRKSDPGGTAKEAKGEEWLLIKHRDLFSRAGTDLLNLNRSVSSHRRASDVASGAVAEPASSVDRRGKTVPGRLDGAQFVPMLAAVAPKAFNDEQWFFEPKLDGMRAVTIIDNGSPRIITRGSRDVARLYPSLTSSLQMYAGRSVVFDGEIVALDEKGVPSFEWLQQRMNLTGDAAIQQAEQAIPVVYYVFDILYAQGLDVRSLPLSERKALLDLWLSPGGQVRSVAYFQGRGEKAYASCVGLGYEGVIAKRRDSRYQSGKRSADWLKIKSTQTDEFVIGGYSRGLGNRDGVFGALLLGQYDDAGNLRYAGHVGTGFSDDLLRSLLVRLEALRTTECPFVNPPARSNDPTWVKPVLVAEARFMHRTSEGRLRAPVFVRLRDDKPAAEVKPAPVVVPEAVSDSTEPSIVSSLSDAIKGAGAAAQIEVGGNALAFTNLDKVFWPEVPGRNGRRALTKRDLLLYFLSVSPYLLPHMKDRPITLTRYPSGITGKHFYQRHWEHAIPPFVQTVRVTSRRTREESEYLTCSNLATLLWLGQIADIELHTWFSRITPAASGENFRDAAEADDEATALDYPDFIAFDLDPYTYSGKEAAGAEPELNRQAFKQACRVARSLKAMLDSLSLAAFLKTSGKTGLHIYVPIVRRYGFDATRAACETIGRFLMQAYPKDVTMTWATSGRTDKVFFDHNMNARSKTIASIYSPRAVLHAGVSTPITWDELDTVYPPDFNLLTVPERLAAVGDLWKGIATAKRDLGSLIDSTQAHPAPPKRTGTFARK